MDVDLDKFFTHWYVLVALTIIGGILSTKLMPFVDRLNAYFPALRRELSAQAQAAHLKRIEQIQADPQGRLVALAIEGRCRIKSFSCYFGAMVFLAFALLIAVGSEPQYTGPFLGSRGLTGFMGGSLVLACIANLISALYYASLAKNWEASVDVALNLPPPQIGP